MIKPTKDFGDKMMWVMWIIIVAPLAFIHIMVIIPILFILYIPTLGWSWELHRKIDRWISNVSS